MPEIVHAASLRVDLIESVTALLTWSRLEALPTTSDLGPALEAQVADPLWLLGRQWQFGEFQGEDAGTPIEVLVEGERARLSRYLPGPLTADAADRAVDYDDLRLPIEIEVEREPIRARHARLSIEAGLHFARCLRAEGVADLARDFAHAYPLTIAASDDDATEAADTRASVWRTLVSRGAIDGAALAAALQPLAPASPGDPLTGVPALPNVQAADRDKVARAGGRWLRWYDEAIAEPRGAGSAWNQHRQEYALALSAKMTDGEVVLVADEYTDGKLDWYSFRAAPGPSLGEAEPAVEPETEDLPRTLPVLARYPGMPADRFWEFEDTRVHFGRLEAGPTDLARLLLVEFALVYGNDWFVVPLELPVGSLFAVKDMAVRDTFGVPTTIGPSRNANGRQWTMFELSAPNGPQHVQDLFFLPPTLASRLEGDPLEEVALFRDEMANLAWGVERRVQGAGGEPYDRSLEAAGRSLHRQIEGEVTAEIVYRLATPVPYHWIPFVAVHDPEQPATSGATRLERRVLRHRTAEGVRKVHPSGILLRSDLTVDVEDEPPLWLAEEEVPREGAIVQRAFQFSRWTDGSRHLWVGRMKRTGRGEGASGLRYDVIEPRR